MEKWQSYMPPAAIQKECFPHSHLKWDSREGSLQLVCWHRFKFTFEIR